MKHKLPVDKCQESLDHMAEDDLAEKEMDLEAVQVSMDIFGSEDDSLDLAEFKFHNRCKFCERRFDSSGEMGRHIGCKHKLNIHQEVTRDGEAFLSSKLACKLCEKNTQIVMKVLEDTKVS